jgi:anti-sigma B factor antagonist
MPDLVSSCPPDAVPRFAIRPRRRATDSVVLEVVGEIDLLATPSLLRAASDEFAGGCRALVLDLAGVTFCSARCLGTLFEIRQLAARHGAAVRVAGASDPVRRVADLTGSRHLLVGETPGSTGVPGDGMPRGGTPVALYEFGR